METDANDDGDQVMMVRSNVSECTGEHGLQGISSKGWAVDDMVLVERSIETVKITLVPIHVLCGTLILAASQSRRWLWT